MEDFISAIKSNDLVKAKKAFNGIMLEQTAGLISKRKIEIAQSIVIEGEEAKEDDEPDEDEDKKGKKSDDDADEGNGKGKDEDDD